MKKNWGFDVRDMDTMVRPQDDFYHYAAGGWLARNPIPESEARWGSFMALRYDTDRQLRTILSELETMKRVTKGSPEQLIRDFYRSGMDMKRRNALGAAPLAPFLKNIEGIKTHTELLTQIAALHRMGVGVLWGTAVDQDSKNSEKYLLHIYQDGLGMPERDYYLKNDPESKRVRDAYLPYVERVLRLMGTKPAKAAGAAATILRIETALAKAWMSKEDRREAEKVYHKKTVRELARLAPAIDWPRYFKNTGAGTLSSVIVMHPEFLAACSTLLTEVSLEDWKTYLSFHVTNDYAGYLSATFVRTSFSFYGTVLSGTKVMKPLWRRTMNAVNGSLGEPLGRIYVHKHFSKDAKYKMELLVADLFEAYEARLKNIDWMTPTTKKKALKKLRAMNRKIGYPDKWKSYAGLTIRPDDFAGNAIRSELFEHRREMKKLAKPIDRTEWFMFPQTVNAYFAPNLNDIVFPAAILQPPFFNLEADDAVNYAAIGSVIGHEITHGFDDQGSKYDEKGNLKSWWTLADRARFEKKASIIVKQYDAYTVADGVHVNGKLTLGENIADLGGIAIAYDAYQLRLKKTGRAVLGGFTPEQRFFLGLTLFERESARPEYQKMQVLTDPHSPAKYRINGPVGNVPAFYEAFTVAKGDALYRDPSVRTTVW
ncbi:MAG TPA: M13 family metallopeptidase [Candidatus Paceibacterota bacterium]|nr:M13 family metallopeptidase [Candidatus Paceibacterota bacterium]